MPPMQENSPTAVAIAFSDRVSEEITIVPSVERAWKRRESVNEKGLERPPLLWRHPWAIQIKPPSGRHGDASVGFKT
jgi:hypothetical protein